MLTRIHVNQHVIKANRTTQNKKPVISVKTSKKTRYAHEVEIDGPAKVIYSPDKPLSCGATVWVETRSPVKIKGKNVVCKAP